MPKSFRQQHEGITVHGLLASYLAFCDHSTETYELWKATWPTKQDLKQSMPVMWPRFFRSAPKFPPAVAGKWGHDSMLHQSVFGENCMLARQELKLSKDWAVVSQIFPTAVFADYQYYWLIVNSRSFYYELPGIDVPSPNDRMVLCPFVDFFNHRDHGVSEVNS